MIMFLIRTVFWLGLVILILPIDKDKVDPTVTQSISADGFAKLASGAVSDVAQFCIRQPETCERGKETLTAFGEKAVYASGVLYKFMQENIGKDDNAEPAHAE